MSHNQKWQQTQSYKVVHLKLEFIVKKVSRWACQSCPCCFDAHKLQHNHKIINEIKGHRYCSDLDNLKDNIYISPSHIHPLSLHSRDGINTFWGGFACVRPNLGFNPILHIQFMPSQEKKSPCDPNVVGILNTINHTVENY